MSKDESSPQKPPIDQGADPATNGAQKSRVTLKDIADLVGVSVSTASRALSNSPGISQELRDQIRGIAQTHNYGKSGSKQQRIALIADLHAAESGAGEFLQAVQRGIEDQAKAEAVNLSMHYVGPNGLPGRDLDEEIDGYLLLSLQNDTLINHVLDHAIPTVIVNGRDPLSRLDSVAPANRTGGYLASHHLVELGHKRILHLTHTARPTIRDRNSGYEKGIREYGIELDQDLVIDLEAMRTNIAYSEIKARLEKTGTPDFTAIQCCSDSVAFGAIAALMEAGFRVPHDVSVIGYDDIPTAALNAVPLTTIKVDAKDLGTRSVKRLMERISGNDHLATYTETSVSLVHRRSTAPVSG